MRLCRLTLLLCQRRAAALLLPLLAASPCAAQAALPRSENRTQSTVLAESAAAVPAPATLEAVLHTLADQAAVVFTGEVLSVERRADAVEVRWQVESAVRGAAAGQVFVLREWAGLWQANNARYVKGQRALLLLHAPSPAGYASPVGGQDGVIALHGDAASGTLDLRLLQQRVLVSDAARLRPMLALRAAGGSLPLSNALQAQDAARQPARAMRAPTAVRNAGRAFAPMRSLPTPDDGATVTMEGSDGGAAPVAAAEANSAVDADLVLSMLQAWQRGDR